MGPLAAIYTVRVCDPATSRPCCPYMELCSGEDKVVLLNGGIAHSSSLEAQWGQKVEQAQGTEEATWLVHNTRSSNTEDNCSLKASNCKSLLLPEPYLHVHIPLKSRVDKKGILKFSPFSLYF